MSSTGGGSCGGGISGRRSRPPSAGGGGGSDSRPPSCGGDGPRRPCVEAGGGGGADDAGGTSVAAAEGVDQGDGVKTGSLGDGLGSGTAGDSKSKVPSSLIVAVRARPLPTAEAAVGGRSAVSVSPTTVTVSPGKSEQNFHFDFAYEGEATQEMIYTDLGAPILRKALQGFNATIFAYGQTGSGKSHTMMGSGQDIGIIPRMGEELFFCVDKALQETPDTKFLLTCSYLEIYNEALQDLLVPAGTKAAQKEVLEIKEHQTLGVHVKGLLELPIRSRSDLVRHMTEGNNRRVTGETKMNARSSRSHSIFTIHIQQQDIVPGTGKKREIWSKINLVDLAGSERAGKTGAEGARMKEGISINQSLSALGGVITALADSARKGKMQFVPYRNSKLTRVLQESLGGNSLTVMIANISSALSNLDETVNTLQYADRAKSIKIKATKNEQMSEVDKLRQQVEEYRLKLAEKVGVVRTEEDEQQLQHYRSQIEEYELRLKRSFEEKAAACERLEAQLRLQRDRLAKVRAERRRRAAEGGDWLHTLAPEHAAWKEGGLLGRLTELHLRQKEADDKLERRSSLLLALLGMLDEAVAALGQQHPPDTSIDLDRTVDLGSVGGRVLRMLDRSDAGRLQQCRQLSLRWEALTASISACAGLRASCVELHNEARKAILQRSEQLSRSRRDAGTGAEGDGEDEAEADATCAAECLAAKVWCSTPKARTPEIGEPMGYGSNVGSMFRRLAPHIGSIRA